MLRAGKLPPDVLTHLLSRIPQLDPRVLLGPGLGRDAAVIDIGNGRVLVAKTDPVTFAAEDIGWYAINVNANDIACMGAQPSWCLATVLLPAEADDGLPGRILDQLIAAATELGIQLVGGHTEVTLGIDRPIVVGAMLGEAAREEIVTGQGIVPGDAVVLAGACGIEGTALLAREAGDALRGAGMSSITLERCRTLLRDPGISIVGVARALTSHARPRLMHDPTEGGVATALWEMASAANATLRIDLAAIRILDETASVCKALNLDPLGLLASGALLAIVSPGDVERVTSSDNPSMFRTIGTVVEGPSTVILQGSNTPFPMFERDEVARYFESMAEGALGE